ncbi:MAG TPA: AMP-binding protein [Candidatus Acidoferrum sp.]|jgi:acyl-CoA synthetase (AMP-forming)/AMP-acid ligase II|nr:AMP-binding protein [Candidatus Acidoferrum sp.]
MLRSRLYADPQDIFIHDAVLGSCRRMGNKIAVVDSSCGRRISYAEYGELVESVALGFVRSGLRPGEVIAIYLSNCWEFCVAYHAATLAGAIPTLLNPSYREREVRYQMENSGAVLLISDGPNVLDLNFAGLPNLRQIYTTRQVAEGTLSFADLLKTSSSTLPMPDESSSLTLGALPYSSGTTGLPKGVMLSHFNLIANVYQFIAPNTTELSADDTILCFLPLYHIYGLNVVLNPALVLGATLVLMPRFNLPNLLELMVSEGVTMMPVVPPALNALCQSAALGQFPTQHRLRWVKTGAAPMARELARSFTASTGVLVCQGYGMTEASPVTHVGYLRPELYRPDSIGRPLVQTECRVIGDAENGSDHEELEVPRGEPGELVMRGPQVMLGYWKEPQATSAVLRDGWYWSGDIVMRDEQDFFYVLDRRKEMIKYKGFPVAPAEVEALLQEHPAVSDCGVVSRPDSIAGEIPVAFIVLCPGVSSSRKLEEEICAFVADRLAHHKQPREIRFMESIPRTPSGKILRRELRSLLG